jgi:hypothetical protein
MGLVFDLGLPHRSAQTIVTAQIGLLIALKPASLPQHEMLANVAVGSFATEMVKANVCTCPLCLR